MARSSKRFIFKLAIAVCIASTMVACQNGDDIGVLYGQWQLDETIEASGERTELEGLYVSFQSGTSWVKQADDQTHSYRDVFAAFQQVGDSLFMHYTSRYGQAADTSLVCRTMWFPSFDDCRLRIITLDGSHLELATESRHWRFSKY